MTAKPKNTLKTSKVSTRPRDKERALYLTSLLANISDALISTDTEFKVLAWNTAAENMYGWKAAEVLGHPVVEFFNTEYLETTRDTVIQTILEKGIWRGEVTQNRKDGARFPVTASISIVRDETGEPIGFVSINRDITEYKQTEEKVRQSQEQYHGLFKHMQEGIAYYEMIYENSQAQDWVYLSVNEAFEQLTGLKEIEGKRVSDVIPNIRITDPALFEIYSRVARSGQPEKFETFVVALQMRFQVSAFSFRKGTFVSIFDVITERKQAEERIKQRNQRLTVLRELDMAILSADSVENIVGAALSHVRELVDCRRANLTLIDRGTNELLIFEASTAGETSIPAGSRLPLIQFEDIIQTLSQNQPVLFSDYRTVVDPRPGVQRLLKDGLLSTCSVPLFSQGSLIGMFSMHSEFPGFFDDERIALGSEVANQVTIAITQNRLIEDLRNFNAELEQRVTERTAELHQSNLELEHANRAKDEFLTNMSHELRTPLNSILGLAETLLEQRRDPITEYQERSLQIIQSSGSHLLDLINDILDLSKIGAGKFDYYPQIISVSELCRSSLAFVKAQVVSKSITLTYQEGIDVSKVYADPRRLKQILVNLLTNAVKFTSMNGQITLEVHCEPEQDRIHFSVIDTGIGIALEDLRQLFVPFKQVDSSLTRDYEGTGLGLALVQKLTDLHGGSVDVKSEVGRGSRFTINLPLGQAMLAQQEVDETGGERVLSEQARKSNTPSDEPLDHGIVLLAEDNMANVLTMSDYLESHGYEIVVAHDGLEAIEQAGETKPNIILIDIQMPAMDGLEVTRRLRANPSFASTPIIALTALAMRGDRERCLEAGANEYMSKPVGLKTLLSTIQNLLANKNK